MAVITVTTTADVSNGGDGVLSLREAVFEANLSGNKDTIRFDKSLAGQTIVLTEGELSLVTDVTIDGDVNRDDKADITISGNDASRIFNQSGNKTDVDLLSLTLTNGYDANMGGAMFVLKGTLDIVDTTIQNSRAGNGAGLYLDYAAVTITNSTIAGNEAGFNGGGFYIYGGTTAMTNTTIVDNSANGYGGGIFAGSDNELTVSSSTVTGNRADADGASTTDGGGIRFQAATLAITNSVVADNFSGSGAVEHDISGTVDAAINSVFGTSVNITTDRGGGSLTGVADVGLGQLLDNGGTVLTRSPLDDSVLIGAGKNGPIPPDARDLDGDGDVLEPLPLDGRGGVRVVGNKVDVGAVERIADETIAGTDGDDTILGGRGEDDLTGGAGDDLLDGGADDDILLGGAGIDTLRGGEGRDRLMGGADRDFLTGGQGDDFFVFSNPATSAVGAGRDRVLDFAQGEDQIDLLGIDADGKAGNGDQAFDFLGTGAFNGERGELRFVQANGRTIVSGDIDGDGAADFQIQINALVALDGGPGGDFLL